MITQHCIYSTEEFWYFWKNYIWNLGHLGENEADIKKKKSVMEYKFKNLSHKKNPLTSLISWVWLKVEKKIWLHILQVRYCFISSVRQYALSKSLIWNHANGHSSFPYVFWRTVVFQVSSVNCWGQSNNLRIFRRKNFKLGARWLFLHAYG